MKKYKSREASVETVRHIFQNTNEDYIALEDAFKSWGRDLSKVEENKAWFSNKLTSLKYHNLVIPIYTTNNNRRILKKIQLTIEGKKAIGRLVKDTGLTIGSVVDIRSEHNEITIEDILKAIPKLRKENPDFDIIFKVTPKEG